MKRTIWSRGAGALACLLSLTSVGLAAEQKVTLNFNEAPVKTVASMIAENANVTVIAAPGDWGTLAKIQAKDVTAAEALRQLAQQANLSLVEINPTTFWLGLAGQEPRVMGRPAQTPVAADGAATMPAPFMLRLHNVSPRVVAWWLDPSHNQEPREFAQSRQNDLLRGTPVEPMAQTGLGLPQGVTSVFAVEPQNALRVLATPTGFEKLKAIVATLDEPLRQVEISSQFVELDADAEDEAGVVWRNETGVGLVRNDSGRRLQALVAAGRAKIISNPRVTAINNLTAAITTTTHFPPVPGADARIAPPPQRLSTGVIVTPTINNDDTITLMLTLRQGAETVADVSRAVETVANVRDGETIALRLSDASGGKRVSVALVTPRILRRLDEAQ